MRARRAASGLAAALAVAAAAAAALAAALAAATFAASAPAAAVATPGAAPASGQQAEPRPVPLTERRLPFVLPGREWQLRLAEIDKLLALGQTSRAAALLAELGQEEVPRQELLPRELQVAQQQGEHAAAARLCREGLALQPGNARWLRELARELIALGEVPAGRAVVDSFVAVSPDPRSGLLVAVDLWRRGGQPQEALALVDAGRRRLGEPRLLARPRAAALVELGRYEEGAEELAADARANLLNLPLLRTDLLEMAATPERARPLAGHLRRLGAAAGPQEGAGAALLGATLELRLGRPDTAAAAVAPLVAHREAAASLLQLCAGLVREVPLLEDAGSQEGTSRFLLETLERLATAPALPAGYRPRVLDLLAQAAEDALDVGALSDDPEDAMARLRRVLGLVAAGSPGSSHLYAAEIRLAQYTRDVLRRPQEAASRLERLLADLSLPLPGVALARLELGRCHFAAGDTARARQVLTRLARGADDRAAAGSAHFLLAKLDLAEGHWETARDRFASVALDNPMADYANDALELGLVVAQELENPVGGPAQLARYARGVYFALTAQPDSQAAALAQLLADDDAAAADGDHPQHLREEARFELAQLLLRQGRPAEALAQCARLLLDHPDGRRPADALALSARIRAAAGDPAAARADLERLLQQYPDYLFADDVRERLRQLP